MRYFIQYDADNEIVGVGSSNADPGFVLSGAQSKEITKAIYDDLRRKKGAYLINDEVHYRPTKPGLYHHWDTKNKVWVLDESLQNVEEAERVRVHRAQLLADSDWTDTLSAKSRLGDDLYNQWQAYRQALRDITTQLGFPLDVVWPTPPG